MEGYIYISNDKRGIEYDNLLISAANSVVRACTYVHCY